MSDEVAERGSAEVEKVMRAAAQIGLLLAERNRQRLWVAEQASRQQADRVRATVEEQRRLAAPVYREATRSAFWERARPEDAAFVYGMARRFAHMDPVAQEAVSRCQDQAAKRWGVDLAQDSRLVTSKDVPTQAVATVAPLLRGEESSDLDSLVDESAQQASTAAAPSEQGATVSATRTPSSDQVLTGPVDAIQATNEPVSKTKHYQVLDLDKAEREALAHELRSYADYIEGGLTFDTSEDEALYSFELSQDATYASDEKAFNEAIDEYRERAAGHEERAAQVVMPWRDLADQVEQTGKLDLTDADARLHVAEVLDNRGWQSLSEIPQPLHRIVQAVQEPEPLALPADVRHQRTESPRWDSREARESWAAEMVGKGFHPEAVRAAKNADQVLTGPVGSVSKAPSRDNGSLRPPEHYVAAAMGRQAGAHQG